MAVYTRIYPVDQNMRGGEPSGVRLSLWKKMLMDAALGGQPLDLASYGFGRLRVAGGNALVCGTPGPMFLEGGNEQRARQLGSFRIKRRLEKKPSFWGGGVSGVL